MEGRMKKIILLLMLTGLLFGQDIFINEFLASNNYCNPDAYGEFDDWVELANTSNDTINLFGWFISDNESNLTKHQFTDSLYIYSDSLLLLWADEDQQQGSDHLNFKLGSGGEEIFLTNPGYIIIDSVFFGQQTPDVSYGRYPNYTGAWGFMSVPTPGGINLPHDSTEYSPDVIVIPEAGFYDDSIYVTLFSDSADVDIYYTLNGSVPDTNSFYYTEPLLLIQTTVIRLITIRSGFQPSLVQTHNFILGSDFNLPTMALTVNPSDLNTLGWFNGFGFDSGEYNVHVTYFEQDGLIGFSCDAGIERHSTDILPQQPYRISFKPEYGTTYIDYPIFENRENHIYKRLILRVAGNDMFPNDPDTTYQNINFNTSHLRDGISHALYENIRPDAGFSSFKSIHLYLNGTYWGIYHLRERQDKHYIEELFGYEDIDLLERAYQCIDFRCTLEGDWMAYDSLEYFVENSDMTQEINFNYLKAEIFYEEFIDYCILEVFIGNHDWLNNNIKFWRPRSGENKWRWLLWDTDLGLGFDFYNFETYWGDPAADYLEWSTGLEGDQTDNGANNRIIRAILRNNEGRIDFINRFADLLNTNLSYPMVLPVIDSLANILNPDMQYQADRWNGDLDDWYNGVENVRNYALEREQHIKDHIKNKFDLDSTFQVSLDLQPFSSGIIQINSINIHSFPWTGTYFSNVPIEISVIPYDGYELNHWNGTNNSSYTLILDSLVQDTTISAILAPISNHSLVINEINYNSASDFDTDDWVELYNNSDSSINISDWQFKDSDDTHVFTIPSNTVLHDSGLLVLCKDTTSFKSLFPDVENYIGNFDFGLSGGGELIRLYDQQGQIVDSLTYDDNSPWPEEPDGNGPTLELINVNLDNALAASWRSSNTIGGSPGSPNIDPIITNLYINEFLASNDSCYADDYSEYDDWIELYNAGDEAIDIGGLFITDDLDDPTSWQIPLTNPNLTTIQPDSFLVLWSDKDMDQGVLHVDFKLSGTGEQIGIAIINFPDTVYIDSLSFGPQTTDISYGRYSDGGEYWQYYETPTPNASNTLPENNPPVLTTLLPDVTIDEDDFGAVIIPNLEAYFHDGDEGDILTYIGSVLDEGLDSLSFSTDESSAAIGRMVNDHGAKVITIKRSELKQHSNSNVFALQRTDKDKSGQKDIMSVNVVIGTIDIRQNRSLSRTDSTALIVYPTLNFNGDVNIAVTCTDTSSSSITDTLILTILPINDVPALALGDTTINEGETIDIILLAGDFDDDELTYSGSSDTNAVIVSLIEDTLSLSLVDNWNGSSVITVVVTDESSTSDTADFILTVNPINDSPEEFSVIYPTVSDTFSTHADNDTLIQFTWGKSYDVDSEINYTLTIVLEFFGNVYTDIHEDISDTTIGISSYSLDPILEVTSQDESVFIYYVHASDGEYTVLDTGEFVLSRESLGINYDTGIPEVFALYQSYPNPFNPITTLRYDLPEQAHVNITIYDMLGREVKTLINQTQDAGYRSIIWDSTNDYGKPVSAGIYLYQIQARKYISTKKMVLLK